MSTFDLSDIKSMECMEYVPVPEGEKNLKKAFDDAQIYCVIMSGLFMGSYTVTPDTANDVDLVVPEHTWNMYAQTAVKKLKLYQYNPVEGDPEYEDAMVFDEIRALYRNTDGLNVVVCNPYMWPAYVKATRIVNEHKEQYSTREARVSLYIECKNAIHEMLGNEPRPID